MLLDWASEWRNPSCGRVWGYLIKREANLSKAMRRESPGSLNDQLGFLCLQSTNPPGAANLSAPVGSALPQNLDSILSLYKGSSRNPGPLVQSTEWLVPPNSYLHLSSLVFLGLIPFWPPGAMSKVQFPGNLFSNPPMQTIHIVGYCQCCWETLLKPGCHL